MALLGPVGGLETKGTEGGYRKGSTGGWDGPVRVGFETEVLKG